jgi:hypothetical protein
VRWRASTRKPAQQAQCVQRLRGGVADEGQAQVDAVVARQALGVQPVLELVRVVADVDPARGPRAIGAVDEVALPGGGAAAGEALVEPDPIGRQRRLRVERQHGAARSGGGEAQRGVTAHRRAIEQHPFEALEEPRRLQRAKQAVKLRAAVPVGVLALDAQHAVPTALQESLSPRGPAQVGLGLARRRGLEAGHQRRPAGQEVHLMADQAQHRRLARGDARDEVLDGAIRQAHGACLRTSRPPA